MKLNGFSYLCSVNREYWFNMVREANNFARTVMLKHQGTWQVKVPVRSIENIRTVKGSTFRSTTVEVEINTSVNRFITTVYHTLMRVGEKARIYDCKTIHLPDNKWMFRLGVGLCCNEGKFDQKRQ